MAIAAFHVPFMFHGCGEGWCKNEKGLAIM